MVVVPVSTGDIQGCGGRLR